MPIDAVHACVDLAAHEPLGVRRLPVQDAVPFTRPFELAGKAGPKTLGITLGLDVDRLVVRGRSRAESGRGWKDAMFFKEIVEFGRFLVCHGGRIAYCRGRQKDVASSVPGGVSFLKI